MPSAHIDINTRAQSLYSVLVHSRAGNIGRLAARKGPAFFAAIDALKKGDRRRRPGGFFGRQRAGDNADAAALARLNVGMP